MAAHLNGPWHIICIQEGAGFVTGTSLAENVHVAPSATAPFSSTKILFARDCTCTSIHVPRSRRYSSKTVEGMVVAGKFRRALVLLIRDLCLKLGAVKLTGDFFKGAEREAAPNGPSDHRRTCQLEAAFSHANIPWPISGVGVAEGPRR